MHARDGRLTFQPYGKDDSEAINSVSRAGLNLALIEAAARYPTVRLFFRQKCTGIDLETGRLELTDETSGNVSHVDTSVVLGADGAFSAVRAQMQKREQFNYHQEYLSHGYKELTIPAGPGGAFRMEKHALHIWPRRSFMMIALPNTDGSFTCTLFWPLEGPNSFAALRTLDEIRRYFEDQFPDAVPLMPTLVEDFQANPVGSLVTIRCNPWHVADKVVLLGDAAHAVVPFLGQGMNAAFEDCTVLANCLARHSGETETAFREYEAARKPNTDTLADLCVENFLEMRDKVGSRLFLLRKRFDNFLHRLFPRWYVTLYTLIQFTTTPYRDAVERVRKQENVLFGLFAVLLVALVIWLRGLVR
jgi:kynurenine 3-monooxygenase